MSLPKGWIYINDTPVSKVSNLPEGWELIDDDEPATPSLPPEKSQPPSSHTTLGGVATSLGEGIARGVTTEIPSMVGGAMEFAGSAKPREEAIVPSPVDAALMVLEETGLSGVIEDLGRGLKEWSDAKSKTLFGEEKKRQGLERVVFEGSKMLGPSILPAGVLNAGVRVLTGIGKLVKAAKAAQIAGQTEQAAKLMEVANKSASLANNVASAGTAGLFGLSQAQSTVDAANKRAGLLQIQGDLEGSDKAREAGQGIAPRATGLIEAGGEFLGTKYLGKLFRLDETSVAKRGAKQLAKDFLKTLGVEVGTEMGQQGGEAGVEKVSGISPEADPLEEALDVVGPTAFMTLLTFGVAGAANRVRRSDDTIDLLDEKQDQQDMAEQIKKAIEETRKQEAKRAETEKAFTIPRLGERKALPSPDQGAIDAAGKEFELKGEPYDPVQRTLEQTAPTTAALPEPKGKGEGFIFKDTETEQDITAKTGEPFKTEKNAKAAGDRQGIDWNIYNIIPKGEGYVVARKLGKPLKPESTIEKVDQAANEAATSPLNDLPQPTEEMKKAGNYQKGHLLGSDINPELSGLEISIENPKGSERSGKDKNGKPWSTVMEHPYGYFKETQGRDKDHIDVFIGPKPESGKVYIVDQIDPETGVFDEHKTILGTDNIEDARKVYLENYQKNWKGLGAITEMPIAEFKAWVKSGRKTKPVAYKRQALKLPEAKSGEQKEPWMMTREEFATEKQQTYSTKMGRPIAARVVDGVGTSSAKKHKTLVEKALSEGKPVPPEVLKDYPELSREPDHIANADKMIDESADIFIRAIKKKEIGQAQKALKTIKDKDGYKKVYKRDGRQGRGFYYIPIKEKDIKVAKPKEKKEGGAQNLAQFLIKAGKVRLGDDFTSRTVTAWDRAHGNKGKDQSRELGIIAQVASKNGKMSMDEAASFANAEGFTDRNGQPFTDVSLFEELAYGDARNILHPSEDLFAEKKVKTENEPINTNTFKRGDIVQPEASSGLPAERYSGRIQGVNIEGNIIVNGKTFSPELFELASENKEAENNKIEDFGEKLGGARKDRSESFKKEYTDADIASLPLSKIWPKNEVDVIEDKFVAAFAASARSEIPTKPQLRGKVLRWVEKVKSFRGMMTDLFNDIESGKYSREKILDKAKAFPSLKGFFAKVRLLEAIDREQWDRIGAVQEHPDAHRFSDKMNDTGGYDHIPAPSVSVYIDGRYRSFEGMKTVEEAISKINEYLDKAAPTKTDSIKSFEVRGSGESYFINKKGDSQYHRLKEFKTSKEALDYRNEHSEELWKAWDAVKELENVTKEDVRNKENRPRTGKDHRGGKDVTPEQFTETFGFRGVEFGNWVAQGKNTKERQGMLNESYDAIMDLANIVGIPPKAISLNGTLGLGFGSRGVGLFSAHFEPDTIVINLTKTRGAGNFAHEWFHALDNYFQRQRDVGESRESQFITYNPETYYQDKGGARLSETRYNEILERGRIHNPANWTKIEGVRPEIAEAFKRLVDVLNKSPMSERVSQIKNDYWSRIIERAARSFENYVIVKMSKQGYQNDYLANVVRLEDFKRMEGRYPYLFDDEIAPVEDAFDNLFSTIKTRETDKGVEMYSIGQRFRETAIPVDDVEPKFLDVKRANSEIITLAAEEYKSWPEKITAADDSEILLANPEDGYISKRALHLIWDNDKDQIHIEKARWLPNVPETLKNAAVRLVDQQSGNRIYVRAYNNVKHMVVVAPDGNVIEQESFKGSLVTQFPYLRPGRQESMIVDWERNGLGRSQGNPNPTPPASTIPESRQGEFQEQNTLSRKNVKDKYSTDDRGYALPMPTLEDIKKAFPGQEIIKTYAGVIIKTRAGKTVLIRGVDYIDVDSFALKIGYNKEQLSKKDVLGEEEVAVGRYKNGVIDLLRGEANRITLSHESVHWMEDIGVLDSRDVAALRGHIKRLVRKKEFEPIKKDDIGGSEDRARFLAEVLNAEEVPKGFVGRIVARIQDFIDGIVNAFGLRTVKGIVRDIKSGEIFKKEGTEKGQTEQYSIRQSRPESEETHGMLKKKWDEFRYQVQDRFRYLEKEQQKVEKRRGSELPETENTYRAETRYHGMAAAAVDDFEENHVEPILKEMEQGNLSLEDVGLYLHARHAPEANARLRKINPTAAEIGGVIRKVKSDRDILKSERATIRKMNPDDYPTNKRYRQTEKEMTALQAEIARLENYEPIDDNTALSGMSDAEAISIQRNLEISSKSQYYKKIGELVDKMTKARRELLIESGLETPETIANWEALYEHYVPLMREGKGAVMPRTGRGYDIRGHQKLRAGSEKDVVNILANLVAQHEATIIRAEKAKVGRVFLEFAKNNKGPWKIDTPEQIATYTADGLIAYKDNPAGYFLADNVLSVRVDGEDHHITFDENNENAMKIASALKNLDGGDSGSVVRVLSKVSRFLAMVNTSLNPEFIISNFLRDIQTAGYNMSDSEADKIRMKAIKQVGSAFKGIWQYERNTNRESEWAEWFNRFRHAGGQTGWIQSYENIKDREKDLVNKVKQMQPGKTRLIRRGLTAAFDYIADTNTAVENAIRLSVFKNLVEAGVSESKAAVISKELTVNFNKKGNLGPVMNAAYLFFNASMQGSARIIMAAAKSRKVQKLMVATAGFALMLDIANRLIGGDGDDGEPLYDKIGDWEKERNLIIMLGSGNGYVKIPLPWGYNVFHVFGQAAGEVLTKKHNKVMDSTLRVLGAAVSAFNPMGGEASIMQVLSPTVIDPFVQWIENKDWSGRKLRPSANVFAEKPSSQTYWKSVREPSRIIAEKLNELTGGDEVRPGKIDFSPEAFDLAIDTFTGGTGKFISNLISTPVKLATGDTVETFEVPFLRKVYGKPGKQVLTQEFYENIDEVRLVSRQINHYKDNPGKVREIVKDYPSEYRLIGRMKATQKTLEEIRKTKQLVTDKIKNEEVKERRLKALDESEEKIMMNFNKQYHRMKEKEK